MVLDIPMVARELRDGQEMYFGERINKNLYSQIEIAAENEHFVVGSRKYRDISCYFNDIVLYYCTKVSQKHTGLLSISLYYYDLRSSAIKVLVLGR